MTAPPAILPPEVLALCPYPGLDAFTAQYRRYFIGRKRDTELLVSNLYASPLTILYGSSGVGKTSVLLAGVVPRIEEAGDAIIVVHRTWQSPSLVAALGSALVRAVEERTGKTTGIDGTRPIDAVVEALVPFWDGPFLVVFDQFEEYFLYPIDRTSPDSFDAAFARAVNRRDLDVHFMISLREDALSGLDRFRHRIPALLGNLYRLEHLSRDEIRRAIVEPLATLRAEHPTATVPTAAEDALPELIVSDQVAFEQGADGGATVVAADRFVTPFLQLVLRRLWEEEARAGSTTLRGATFERLGRATGVVRLRIHDALSALTPEEQRVAASVLRYLVTPSGAKVALGVGDLEGYVDAPAGQLRDIALKLAAQEQRILRAVQHPSGRPELTRFEIFHDALARPLLDWRVAFDRAAAEHDALAQAARELQARDEARRKRIAARVRMFGVGAAVVTLLAAGVWGLRQFSGQAAARELAARASTRIEQNRGLAILLALEALDRDPQSADADEVLRRALFEAGEVAQTPLGADPDALVLSPDGRWLMALSSGDTTHVVATGSLSDTLNIWSDSASVLDARFSADSRYLAVVSSDGALRLFDLVGARLVSRRAPVCSSAPISVAVTREAAALFVSCDDGRVRGWRGDDSSSTGTEVWPAWEGNYELRTSPDGMNVVAFADGEAPRLVNVAGFSIGPPLSTGDEPPNELLFTSGNRLIGVHWGVPHLDEIPLDSARRGAQWVTKCTPTALDVARTSPVVLIGCDDGAMSQAVLPAVPVGEANALASNVAAQVTQAAPRGGPLAELRLTGHAGGITAAEVSDDGRLGFSVGPEGAIVWDLASRRSMRSIRPASGTFSKGIFLRDNARLATVTSDGILQLWALDAASRMFASPGTGHLGAALSPGEGRYVVSANEREGARVWVADGSGTTWDVGVAGRLASIPAFSPDGSRIAMMWGNGEVTEFDIASRRSTWTTSPQRVARVPDQTLLSRKGGLGVQYAGQGAADGDVSRGEVQYAAGGDVLLTAAFQRERYSRSSGKSRLVLRLLHRDDDAPRVELDSIGDATAVALSPDGATIAVAFVTGEVRTYDVASRTWVQRLPPGDLPASRLAYRADGTLLAVRGRDAWVMRRPAAPSLPGRGAPSTPPQAQRLEGSGGTIAALAWSAANTLVAAGDTIGNVDVWDTGAAALRCSLPALHSDRVTTLAFAPSGAVLASGSDDRSVAVSAVGERCRFLYRVQPNEDAVTGVAFRATKPPFLVVASAGGVVRRYERDLWGTPEELHALARSRLGGRRLTEAERREYKLDPAR